VRTGEESRDTIVNLLQNFGNEKVLILLSDEVIYVTTSLSLFKNNMNKWLEENPSLKEDEKLLNLIIQQKNGNTIINAEKTAQINNLEERLGYRIADLLDKGQCLIVNKKSMQPVKKVKIQTYSYYCGPLCGNGGRRYYINNMLFFKVMDWIS